MATLRFKEIKISKIKIGEQTRKELGDIEGLARSIKRIGLLQPIVVQEDGSKFKLIAGYRRIQAAKHLSWETVAAQILEEGGEAWRP